MSVLLANQRPMTDQQRRAMFARLRHGGGRSASTNEVPDAGSSAGDDIQSQESTRLSDERLLEIDRYETDGMEQLRRAIQEHRSTSLPDQFFTKLLHGVGNLSGGAATVVDPFEKLLGDPAVKGPLTQALEDFDSYIHTEVPDVTPKGKSATAAALAGGALPYITGGELVGSLSWVQKAIASMGTVGSVIASWKTPLIAALTSLGIGKYREKNPTMDPKAEKTLAMTQQIAGYVSAVTGIGAGKGAVSAVAPNQLEKLSAGIRKLGEKASSVGDRIAEKIPDAVKSPLKKVHAGYTKVADITGASLTDLMNAPQIRPMLDKAKSLRASAQAARSQADEIEASATQLADEMKYKAGDILKASHKGSLADWESAQRMYGEGAAKWYAAEYGSVESKRVAQQMREQAEQMMELAAQTEKDAYNSAVKAALVAAGFTAKEIHEESTIADYQQQMESAWSQGDSFTLPAEQPRGVAGTIGAALVGTLGNPLEKQTRYGTGSYAAQVANYRAKYDAIAKAEQSGELTREEADAMRLDLSQNEKPWNMAGKGAWTFAPASAAFVAWQAGNLSDYFNHNVEVGTVTKVLDGDTIEVAGQKIRMLGVDTPESVHPDKPVEYLGPEASHYQKDQLTGKTVRLVQSPGVDTDKYGRTLRYVETLPGPLDKLFKLPGVGKWIPGEDQNLNMIEQGYGQPRYLELSGGHERQKDYDKAVARAKRDGVGVWSPEGLEKLDYHYQTYNERMGRPPPYEGSQIGNLLGSGLMLTGQSGALKEMGPSGNAVAQAWNAALAGIGVADYNAKASSRTNDIVFRPPRTLRTDYEQHADTVLKKRKSKKVQNRS